MTHVLLYNFKKKEDFMTSKYQGITGKFLEINLTTGEINDYKIPDLDYKLFLGGKALAAKILWDKLMPRVDPLGPHNIMVLSTGPLNGSSAPQSSRFNISTKSPLSLGITSSNSGGDFGTTLKKSGLDGIILKGKADIPTWIEIIDGKVTLRDAGHIWGKNTEETIDGIDNDGDGLIDEDSDYHSAGEVEVDITDYIGMFESWFERI